MIGRTHDRHSPADAQCPAVPIGSRPYPRLVDEPRRSRRRSAARNLPSVGVVIPTRDRPEAMGQALKAVLAQDYAGPMRVIVVYDGTPPDYLLARALPRPVMVLSNWRTPGLAGTRNTGVLGLDTDLVAFCDDDTEWASGKITAQVQALIARPGVGVRHVRDRGRARGSPDAAAGRSGHRTRRGPPRRPHGDAPLVDVPDASGRAPWRARSGGRGCAGQRQRRLGSAAPRGETVAGRTCGPGPRTGPVATTSRTRRTSMRPGSPRCAG